MMISLWLVRKSDLLVSISLLIVSKSDFLVSISLLLVRKSDLLVSISLLLVSKSDFRVAERQARYFPAKSAYSENRRGRDVAVPAGLSGTGWKLRAGSLAWHGDRFFMRPGYAGFQLKSAPT